MLAPILVLEPGLPLELEVVSGLVDDAVEHRGFRCAAPIMLEPLLHFLPRVAPGHAGGFVGVQILGASELARLRMGIQAIFQGDGYAALTSAVCVCLDPGFSLETRCSPWDHMALA